MVCRHRALLLHTNLKKKKTKDPPEVELEPLRGSHFLFQSFYSTMPSCVGVRWMAGVELATYRVLHAECTTLVLNHSVGGVFSNF